MTTKPDEFSRAYDRLMLRSAFVSLIVNGLRHRKRAERSFGLSALARLVGKDKATLSRDLGGSPNWRSDTLADLANALDLEIRVSAVDRKTGAEIGCVGDPVSVTKTFEVDMPVRHAPAPSAHLWVSETA